MGPMRVFARHEYPASCDAVADMMADPRFGSRLATSSGAVSHQASPGRLELELPAPPKLARVFGDTLTLIQTLSWDPPEPGRETRSGRLEFQTPGAPLDAWTAVGLAPAATGCVAVFDGALTVKLPLVGPAVERVVEPYVTRALASMRDLGLEWLAGGQPTAGASG